MKLISNKLCRRRYKIQFRLRRWFFGAKRKDVNRGMRDEDTRRDKE